jgi:hypothetical protein
MKNVTPFVVVVMAVVAMGSLARRSRADVYTCTLQGSRLEVRFEPEKPIILAGEPIYLVFSVTNLSDQTLHLIVGKEHIPGADNRSRFALAAVREEDHARISPQPPPGSGVAYNALVGPNDLLPHKPYLFYLFLPQELPLTKPGTYTIGCSKLLEVLKPLPDGGWDMHGKPDTAYVELKAQLTILPADRAGMGRVIDHFGQAAIIDYKDSGAKQGAAWRAADALAAIADERTVPWLVRLLECRDGMRKRQALDALSRFNNPVAYAAIKSGLATRGSDLDDCTTPRVAADSARSIHLDAARALSKCPYPAALALLKSLRHDPDERIRLQVVQFFGNRMGAGADAVLRELTHDKSAMVRDEAVRYLRQHAPRNSA